MPWNRRVLDSGEGVDHEVDCSIAFYQIQLTVDRDLEFVDDSDLRQSSLSNTRLQISQEPACLSAKH